MNSELGQHACTNLRVTISHDGFEPEYLFEATCDKVYTRVPLDINDANTREYVSYPAMAHEMMLAEHRKFPKGKNNFFSPLTRKIDND